MAVIAMTCMAFLAHTVLTTCLVEPFVFADNWSFVAESLQSLQTGCQGLVKLWNSFKLQLSPDKSWVSSTVRTWRKKLRRVSYERVPVPVLWHAKDLGVEC